MFRVLTMVLLIASVGHQAKGDDGAIGGPDTAGANLNNATAGCCATSDGQSIRERLNRHLDELTANACSTGIPFVERVDKAASTLTALRKFIRTARSSNPHLDEEDMIHLGHVESGIDEREWIPGGKLTGKAVLQFEVDLASAFSAHYVRHHPVGEDGKLSLDDFRHTWARKIYLGLSCLRIPDGYG